MQVVGVVVPKPLGPPAAVVLAAAAAVGDGMVLHGDLVVLPEDNQEHQEDLYPRLPHFLLVQAQRPMGGVVMVEPVPAVVVVVWELVLYVVVQVVPVS
jgi:uncharacterized membrane protein